MKKILCLVLLLLAQPTVSMAVLEATMAHGLHRNNVAARQLEQSEADIEAGTVRYNAMQEEDRSRHPHHVWCSCLILFGVVVTFFIARIVSPETVGAILE